MYTISQDLYGNLQILRTYMAMYKLSGHISQCKDFQYIHDNVTIYWTYL